MCVREGGGRGEEGGGGYVCANHIIYGATDRGLQVASWLSTGGGK